VLDIEAIKQK